MNNYGYNYNYDVDTSFLTGLSAGMIMAFLVISFFIAILTLISMWKIYQKAGKPGWAVLIPIYNTIVLLEIVELPLWYLVLYIVPFANIYVAIKTYVELAHKFGRSTTYGIMMIFFPEILIPILGLGSAKYVGNFNEMNQNMINEQIAEANNQNIAQEMSNTPNFCPYCGAEAKPGDTFCNSCGSRLK